MERSIEIFAVIVFTVIGLSHILQPRAWVDFFLRLIAMGETGAFVDGVLNLQMAGLIIGFHNTWSGIPAALTLVGWAFLFKSVLRFCAPRLSLRLMSRVSMDRAWEFQAAGVALIALAGVVGYGAYTR